MKADAIVKTLMLAKDAYYNGEPIMSDEEFDALEDSLQEMDPANPYFDIVGAVNKKLKVKHEVPMLSLQKSKSVEEVISWLEKIGAKKEELIVQSKIDGLSCSIVYENGKLVLVKTRGDGHIGQDITHISKFVKIPKVVSSKSKVEVRGELFLPKNTTLPNPENKPLRNLAVGLINRKDDGLEDLQYVHFVAYQALNGPFSKEISKMEWLEDNKFEVCWWGVASEFEIQSMFDLYLTTWRDKWAYESDGLVVTVSDNKIWASIDSKYEVSHHHHYNMALKPPSQGKQTILEGIEWNVSRQGKLIPVALVKPVILGGAKVSRCTLNNFENVINLKLHIGDEVIVERAGDVIPFFKQNLSKNKDCGKNIIPTTCPSCNQELKQDGVHLVCHNFYCKEQQVLKIVHWVENCEMEQFSEASVRTLFEADKLWDIVSLYTLKVEDFAGVNGFGSSKINNALAQIEASKEMSIGQFVDRLGIDLVGEKAIKKLGIETAKQLLDFNDPTFVIGRNLISFLKENKVFVKQLLQIVKIQNPQEGKMGTKNVCMTGTGPRGRKELIIEIEKMGYSFMDHVNKDTHILVCEDVNGSSSKLIKAAKLGVELVSYSEFFSK